jgi:hypothetical protein
MKTWLLKAFASAALKTAVASAAAIVVIVVDALNGIVNGGNISDEYRNRLATVISAMVSVRDFLARLRDLLGVAPIPLESSVMMSAQLTDAARRLREATESL